MTTQIEHLTDELKRELAQSLDTLHNDISQVEGELDLELDNLRDLLDKRSPELTRQLEALNTSINRLHSSLGSVRKHLDVARSDSSALQDNLREAREQIEEGAPASNVATEESLSASQAESERHPDKVSLGGILRALLMADEPAQRKG